MTFVGQSKKQGKGAVAGIAVAIVLLVIIVALIGLYVYSYRNPTSVPGQFLIKVNIFSFKCVFVFVLSCMTRIGSTMRK